MACCGQNRSSAEATVSAAPAYVGTHASGRASRAPAFQSRPAPATADTVTLRSRDRGSTVVTGPVSGQRYQFPAGMSMVAIDRRDAQRLVDTGLFERVWG